MSRYIGDATTLTTLLQTLSHYYQGLSPPPEPKFYRRHWPRPPPGSEGEAMYQRYTPHVTKSYPLADVVAKYTAEAQTACMMDLKFSAFHLEELHKQASRWEPDDQWYNQDRMKLTRQDALSAYLIGLHNRCSDRPIHSLMNMMSVRIVSSTACRKQNSNAVSLV